jgi:hypothetical protein
VLALRATRRDRQLIEALARLENETPSELMHRLLARAVVERFGDLAKPSAPAPPIKEEVEG